MIHSSVKKQVHILQELVELNSASTNIPGVSQVQESIGNHLKKLGFDTVFESKDGSYNSEKLLVAELTQLKSNRPYVNLVTHADTVYEVKNGEKCKVKIDWNQMIGVGPGVIDDKGGVVIALAGLERFLKHYDNGLNIRFICSPSEELGSPGLKNLFEKYSKDANLVLAFEPSLEDGSIVESRRGNRWYNLNVDGIEGHSGRDHRSGVNAAHELAHKLVELQGLTDYDKNLTVSIGEIDGGSKHNIICGHARAKLDVRFSDIETRDQAHRKIEEIIYSSHIAPNKNGKLPISNYEIVDDCPPLASSKESISLIQKYLGVIESVEGRSVKSTQAGGTADCNYMYREGLPIIDGLGATGGGMHTTNEFIHIRSLETRSECLNRFLQLVSGVPSQMIMKTEECI